MAQVVNVTPASQVSQVEINNRQLNVTVQKEVKSVDVTLETRGDIGVEISRAVSQTGVQNIIGGADISVSNVAGNVTVSFAPDGFTSTGNITAPYFLGNVIGNISGNIVVPGLNTDVLYNNNGNAGANSNFQYNSANATLTVTGNIVATNISGNGSGLSAIAGGNVTGTVANATYATSAGTATSAITATSATTAGTVTTNAQPNITSVGTLTTLDVTSNVSAGNIKSDNLLYANGSPYQFTTNAAGTNTQVQFNDNNSFGAESTFTFNKTTGLVTATGFSGNGAQLTSITGANVTGTVANATHTVNADSSLTAGTVTTNAQPNITSVGTLNGLSITGQVTGNLIPTGNIQYSLGNATNRWNDLYLAGNTIYLGGVELSATNGELSIPGANLSGDLNTTGNANISSDLNVTGNAVITGNLTVNGNTYYTNVETLVVEDPIIEQGGGPNGAPLTSNDGKDRGELLQYYTTEPVSAFMGWDNSGSEFIFGSNVTNTSEVITVNTYGNLHAGNANLGNLVTANFYTGTLTTAAQPNITSVGTLVNLTVSGNAILNSNVTGVDSLTFDTANAPAAVSVGQLSWNDGDGTLDLGLKGGNVTLQIGEELVSRVYNADSVTLTDGMIVQVVGAQGNRISVKRAQANTETDSVHTLGMVTESIAVGGEGFVTTVGTVHQLNTIGLTAGATLYLSPSTPGAYTQTKPTAPDNLVIIGFVERVHATVGSIYVKVDNGYELDELHNVLITSPTNGQALVYSTGAGNIWINGNPEQANYANIANSVAGANVTGTVANATNANNISTTLYSGIAPSYPVFTTVSSNGYVNLVKNTSFSANMNDGSFSASRLVSTVATGTAPFTVTSTTTVANLSAANATYSNTSNVSLYSNVVADTTTNQDFFLTFVSGTDGQIIKIDNDAASNLRYRPTTNTLGVANIVAGAAITAVGTITGGNLSTAGNATVSGNLRTNNIRSTAGDYMIQRVGSFGDWQTGGNVIIGGVDTTGSANLGIKGNLNFVDGANVVVASFTNNYVGNITVNATKFKLGSNSNVMITGGTSGQVLSTDGLGNLSWVTGGGGGGGTPGGLPTQLQFNDSGSFGGISTVTYDGTNLSLGSVDNVKMTGGSSNLFVRTDGTGNLSFQAITSNLTVATRTVATNITISNYQMNVEARSGNVTVNVN